jgi:hypothetical protein
MSKKHATAVAEPVPRPAPSLAGERRFTEQYTIKAAAAAVALLLRRSTFAWPAVRTGHATRCQPPRTTIRNEISLVTRPRQIIALARSTAS